MCGRRGLAERQGLQLEIEALERRLNIEKRELQDKIEGLDRTLSMLSRSRMLKLGRFLRRVCGLQLH